MRFRRAGYIIRGRLRVITAIDVGAAEISPAAKYQGLPNLMLCREDAPRSIFI